MLLLSQTRKAGYATLICLCVLILFSENAIADPGCRYMGRVYYRRVSSPPNTVYEYYTNEYWIQYNSANSCNSIATANDTYVLTSELSSRTPRNSRCYVNYANNYVQGTGVTFSETHLCPIDDYVPYILFAMLPLAVYFSKRQFAM